MTMENSSSSKETISWFTLRSWIAPRPSLQKRAVLVGAVGLVIVACVVVLPPVAAWVGHWLGGLDRRIDQAIAHASAHFVREVWAPATQTERAILIGVAVIGAMQLLILCCLPENRKTGN